MRLAMLGAAAVELVLFAVALRMVDMSNRLERLEFVLSILSSVGSERARLVGQLP